MIEELKKNKCGKKIYDIDLKKYTSYKLNESAKVLVIPENLKELLTLLKLIKEKK